jgi:LmbE family N-acetylglucosaminyl deacetylase
VDWTRIIAVGSHSDDLEISIGGTLAKFSAMGRKKKRGQVSTIDKLDFY